MLRYKWQIEATFCIILSLILKNFLFLIIFCFSEYEKKLFNKKQAIIKKFYPIGSLTSAFANKFIKLKKKNLLLKYDICLISQPFDGIEFPQVKNFSKIEGLIAKFTHRLCKEKNLSLVFVGKRKKYNGGKTGNSVL